MAGGQVVQDHDVVAAIGQHRRDDASDVPGSTGDQQSQGTLSPRSTAAAASGAMSLMNEPMPDSVPARYFSLPGPRRMVNNSRCSANSWRPTVTGAWCQAEM